MIKKAFKMCSDLTIFDYIRVKIDRLSCKLPFFIKKRQQRKLKKILKYANRHCNYYKNLNINSKEIYNLERYPFLTKKIIIDNFDDIMSDNRSKMIKYVSHTGGSTGEPLELCQGPGHDDIFQIKLWKRKGYKNGDIILALDGAKVDSEAIKNRKYLYIKSKTQLPYGGYGLSSLYITDDNIGEYCNFIKELKPQFIRGYPSFVYRISNYIIKNKIEMNLNLKGIELTSESSYQYQYDVIRKAFNCDIFLQYGHTEACVFGYTFDDSMRYYCEPLYGIVEVINEKGKHVKKGETGEVVVTTLHNYLMPLIRYKTGDYAEYGGVDDGKVVLNKVLGRTQDYIYDRNNNKVLLTALIFAQHFDALGKIERWQIEQYKSGMVTLRIKKNKDYKKSSEMEIKQLFDKVGNVDVEFDYKSKFVLTPRGKSMLLIQHIKDV